MRVAALVVLLACTACVSPQTTSRSAIPTRAILYTNSVNVIMSEGSLCASNRPGRAVEWRGTLTGCPYQYAYQARQNTSAAARQPLQKSDIAAPAGPQIIITDAKGKAHIFTLP